MLNISSSGEIVRFTQVIILLLLSRVGELAVELLMVRGLSELIGRKEFQNDIVLTDRIG